MPVPGHPLDQDSRQIRIQGFKGRVRKGVDPAGLEQIILALLAASGAPPPSLTLVKVKADKGSAIFSARVDLGAGEEEVYLKRFSPALYFRVMLRRLFSGKGLKRPHHYPIKLIKALFEKSPARRSWEAAAACQCAGIPVAEPLLYISGRRKLLREEILVTRGVNPRSAPNARQYFELNFAPPLSRVKVAYKRELIRELGALLRKVRESAVMFPDFKLHNLVLAEPPGERPRFVVIDISEAEPGRTDYLEPVFLERFSPQVLRSPAFTRADYVRLLRAYLEEGHDSRSWPELCQAIIERAKKQKREIKP